MTFREWFIQHTAGPEAEQMRGYFYAAQVVIGAVFILAWGWFRNRDNPSSFRSREGDVKKPGKAAGFNLNAHDPLAQAKLQPKSAPLQLAGIRIDAPAHEILGVPLSADENQIRSAYRERMKQYHPDKVGRPGTSEWAAAQKIAEAINHAKDELMKSLESRGRSGGGGGRS